MSHTRLGLVAVLLVLCSLMRASNFVYDYTFKSGDLSELTANSSRQFTFDNVLWTFHLEGEGATLTYIASKSYYQLTPGPTASATLTITSKAESFDGYLAKVGMRAYCNNTDKVTYTCYAGTESKSPALNTTQIATSSFNPDTFCEGQARIVVSVQPGGTFSFSKLLVTTANTIVASTGEKLVAMSHNQSQTYKSYLQSQDVDIVNGKAIVTDESNTSYKDIYWRLTQNSSTVQIYDIDMNGLTWTSSTLCVKSNPLSSDNYNWTFDEENNCFYYMYNGTKRNVAVTQSLFGVLSFYNGKPQTPAYPIPLVKGYRRDNLTVGKLATLCLPRTAAVADCSGAKFYELEGKTLDNRGEVYSVVFKQVTDTLKGGMPYVMIPTATTLLVAYTGLDKAASNHNGLYGVLGGSVSVGETDNCYAISGGIVVKCADGSSIGANRAYIKMSEVPVYEGTRPASSNAKELWLDVAGANTTHIVAVDEQGPTTVKKAGIYNLSGQRVSDSYKGIRIVNGKKVVSVK